MRELQVRGPNSLINLEYLIQRNLLHKVNSQLTVDSPFMLGGGLTQVSVGNADGGVGNFSCDVTLFGNGGRGASGCSSSVSLLGILTIVITIVEKNIKW